MSTILNYLKWTHNQIIKLKPDLQSHKAIHGKLISTSESGKRNSLMKQCLLQGNFLLNKLRRKCFDPIMEFTSCRLDEGFFWYVFNCQE
jgi:hypothetical protein